MDVKDMRNAIINAPKYKGSNKWAARVKTMGDNQVIAIYFRLKEAGELDPLRIRIVKTCRQ